MGWLNKKSDTDADLPEALRGKSPEDILKELDAKKAAEDRAAAAETADQATKAQLTEATTQLEQLRQQLQQIQASPREEPVAQPNAFPSVLDNEEAAFQARLAPVHISALQSAALTARLTAQGEILRSDPAEAELFKKYSNEVDQWFAQVPLGHQTNPRSYHNCFDLVKGRHFGELMAAAKKQQGSAFSEEGGAPAPAGPTGPSDKPSPEDIAQAKKFGIDPQKYFDAKRRMKIVA